MAFKNPNCTPKYCREYYGISWVLWNLMGPFSENLMGDTATTFKLLTTMISRGILDWCGVLCGEYERILRINYWGAFQKIAELFAVVGCYQRVWNTWGSCRMWESEELQNKTSLTTSGMNPDFPRNQLRSARERSRVVEFQLPLARGLPRDSPWRGWKIGAVGRGLPKKIVISCYFIRFSTHDIWWYVMIFVYFPHSCQAAQPSKIRLFSFRIGNHGFRAPPNLGNSTDGRFPSPFYIAINGRVRFLFSNCRWCLSSIISSDRVWFRWKFSNPSHGWYFGCLLSGQTYMVPKSSISNQIQKGHFEVVPLLIVISGEILVLSSNNGRTFQTQTWRISRFKKNWYNSNLMHCVSWMRNTVLLLQNPSQSMAPYSPKQSKGLLW